MPRFLPAARYWATNVVVADQGSTDGTLEMAQNTPGVTAVINTMPGYDEAYRQQLLLKHAREFKGRRVLIALDADEALSANCLTSPEWQRIAEAQPGTVLRFRWVNVLPGFQKAWIPPDRTAFGFVDDGSEHVAQRIHSRRVPWPAGAPVLDLDDIVVLHFQYVAWDRVVSKHHWYQVWEHLNYPDKGPLQIYRHYHHMYGSWDTSEIHPMRSEWLAGYEEKGIHYRSLTSEPVKWWDREILDLMRRHGPAHFRKIAVWDTDWNAFAASLGKRDMDFSDPRTSGEKIAHRLLAATQRHRMNWGVRGFERLLRMCGW